MAFSPDGRLLATAAGDGGVGLWEASSGKRKCTPEGPHAGGQLGRVEPRRRAIGRRGGRRVSPPVGREQRRAVSHLLDGHSQAGAWRAVRPRRQGRRQLQRGRHDPPVGSSDGEGIAGDGGHHGAVFGVAFSPDGRDAGQRGATGLAMLWDPASGKMQCVLEGHTDAPCSPSPSAPTARRWRRRRATGRCGCGRWRWDGRTGWRPHAVTFPIRLVELVFSGVSGVSGVSPDTPELFCNISFVVVFSAVARSRCTCPTLTLSCSAIGADALSFCSRRLYSCNSCRPVGRLPLAVVSPLRTFPAAAPG